mmetsp:Transcript_58239/g.103905  ORF Transcript_58239/g.103905 Transcript_58239/m.103905 type:complete len:288 (-) Transcript_58239:552-1415(-)
MAGSVGDLVQGILLLCLGPFIILMGQDMFESVMVLNGFITGGIAALTLKFQTVGRFYPSLILEIFSTVLMALSMSTSTIQNPELGARLQGAIIFRQIVAQFEQPLTLWIVGWAGCTGFDIALRSEEFPLGLPLSCNPTDIDVRLVLLVAFAITNGLVVLGAVVAGKLALWMMIFNGSAVGANMCINGVFAIILFCTAEAEFDNRAKYLEGVRIIPYFVLCIIGFLLQALVRLYRANKAKADAALLEGEDPKPPSVIDRLGAPLSAFFELLKKKMVFPTALVATSELT